MLTLKDIKRICDSYCGCNGANDPWDMCDACSVYACIVALIDERLSDDSMGDL